jgi:hypothetical protein
VSSLSEGGGFLGTPDLGAGRLEDPFGLDNGPAEAAERILAARRRVTVAARQYLVASSMTSQIRQIPPRAVSNSEKSICASSLAGSRRISIGCVGTRNAGMAVGHGVGCHREVR